MEKAKPSKKKAYYKNRKPEAAAAVSNKYIDWRQVGKKKQRHTEQDEDSRTELDEDSCTGQDAPPAQDTAEEKCFSKRPLRQPKSHFDDLDEIWQETNVGQDFEILANAPLSTSHFVFKSEKNWTLDASKYDEFFSVDMKNLAAIMNCIPFNQLIELDNKYFTKDELTDINNTAEQAKKAYKRTLKSLRKEKLETDSTASRLLREKDDYSNTNQSLQSTKLTDEVNLDSKTIEEDLDFLLSLKEPVRAQPVAVNVAPPTKSGPDEIKAKNIPAPTKSIDLEKWLDLVLDE